MRAIHGIFMFVICILAVLIFQFVFYGFPITGNDVCQSLRYDKAVGDWPIYGCIKRGDFVENAVYCEQDNLDVFIRVFTFRKMERECWSLLH